MVIRVMSPALAADLTYNLLCYGERSRAIQKFQLSVDRMRSDTQSCRVQGVSELD